MKLPEIFHRAADSSSVPTNTVVLTGAIGGVLPRVTPTNVSNLFTHIPGHGMSGVSNPIAARPPAAPMLRSSNYHSLIPGVSRNLGVDSVDFQRGSPDIHPAAVTDVQHASNIGVHASVARQVARGNGSV